MTLMRWQQVELRPAGGWSVKPAEANHWKSSSSPDAGLRAELGVAAHI